MSYSKADIVNHKFSQSQSSPGDLDHTIETARPPHWQSIRALAGKANASDCAGCRAGSLLFVRAESEEVGGSWKTSYFFTEGDHQAAERGNFSLLFR